MATVLKIKAKLENIDCQMYSIEFTVMPVIPMKVNFDLNILDDIGRYKGLDVPEP